MDDAYDLLSKNKLDDESFSDEIRRVLTKKNTRPLSDFFGIISDEDGKAMLDDLKKIKSAELRNLKKRLN
jgi:predicted CopG family antitoxin